MKTRLLVGLVTGFILFCIAEAVDASLIVMGTVEYAGAKRKLIYDTDLDITWLDYTHDHASHFAQVDWAGNLSLEVDGMTYDNWRLPAAGIAADATEMGYLSYIELGNTGPLINTGPFDSLKQDTYWSFIMVSGQYGCWDFSTGNGCSNPNGNWPWFYGLAVHPGQVIPTTSTSTSTTTSSTTTTTQQPTTSGRPVPDTGQTTSYAVGDDGYYSINPRSYTGNGNGTVTDNVTKLVWQQQDDGQQRTFVEANGYCEGLTLGEVSDWRLPTAQELASVVDYGKFGETNPAIDLTAFPGTQGSRYWSSTTSEESSSYAWFVSFSQSVDVSYGDGTSGYYVRCVRGGQMSWPLGSLVTNNISTATDTNTGLSWQRQDSGPQKSWSDALSYCEGLTLEGFTDWRLPIVSELLSLVDYSKSSPAIDGAVFPGTKSSWYYSSTSAYLLHPGNVWGVDFQVGKIADFSTSNNYTFVRCVRSGPINGTIGALAISSPSQGATFRGGTLHITWSDPQNIGGQVFISLSRDGGKSWETITTSTANDGVYDWAVIGSESVNCVLKVEPIGATDSKLLSKQY